MQKDYALFKNTESIIEVEFPDLEECQTFGADWDEAYCVLA